MNKDDEADFDAFARTNTGRLLRAAVLLTHDWQLAEDLVQISLQRTCIHWSRASRSPYAYARKVMVNQSTDWWRRRRWSEHALDTLDVADAAHDLAGSAANRDLAARMLAGLAPRERAVIVLRFCEDLSEAETAEVLGIARGTVKSATNRALAKLRVAAAAQHEPSNGVTP